MSRDAMLTAIRRGLRRGPLPADQVAMLRGRLATHPRHLIPARSRLPHPEQIDLFVRNVEKEFGSVVRVPTPLPYPASWPTTCRRRTCPASWSWRRIRSCRRSTGPPARC